MIVDEYFYFYYLIIPIFLDKNKHVFLENISMHIRKLFYFMLFLFIAVKNIGTKLYFNITRLFFPKTKII